MSAERAVFRRVLRLCRQVDRNPAKIAASMGAPPRFYDQINGRMEALSCTQSPFVKDTMSEIRGGSTQFAHPVGDAVRAVRRHKCLAQSLGLNYIKKAVEICDQLEAAQKIATDIFQTAEYSSEKLMPSAMEGPTLKSFKAN